MIPVPEPHERPVAAAGFAPFEPARTPGPLRALAGLGLAEAEETGTGALLRFRSMMAAEGQHVHLTRLCYDRLYAYERIAVAHASGHEELRRLALELFQICHQRPGAGMPAQ